jgi:hypothetical protein
MWIPVKYPELELVSVFVEASRDLKSTFQDIEDAKKPSGPAQKPLILFLRLSKLFIP